MVRIILIGLIIIFIIVLMYSYHSIKEGFSIFSDISQDASSAVSDIGSGLSNISQDASSAVSDIGSGISNVENAILPSSSGQQPQQQQPLPQFPVMGEQQGKPKSEITVSGPGFDAMTLQQKADLLKDIQKVVRNELLAERQTTNILQQQQLQPQVTTATQQGIEYNSECKKKCEGPCPRNKDGSCPPVPDMSEYIRKDQIPCWGCSLDY